MQHKMHSNLDDSLKLQHQMSELINSSANRVSNLTQQIETFVEKIHEDIDTNYASIRNLLGVINQGLINVVEIQGYIHAEITTVNGIVYFLTLFFGILFLTSFKKY